MAGRRPCASSMPDLWAGAAERAYWQLTAHGDNPDHLLMADGFDPAALLQHGGARRPRRRTRRHPEPGPHPHRPAARRRAAPGPHRSAHGDLPGRRTDHRRPPPRHWLEHINYVTETLDTILGAVHMAVIDAGEAWIQGPYIDVLSGGPTPSRPPTPEWTEPSWWHESIPSPAPELAEDRWRPLADSVNPFAAGGDWPALAAEIDRAAVRGYDVTKRLPELAVAQPLPDRRPATELQYRLLADTEAASVPAGNRDLRVQSQADHPRRPQSPPTAADGRQLPRRGR